MTRRKDGLWQEVLRINGKQKYFYGRSKAEVLRKIREYQEKEVQGKLFSEVADEWWEDHERTLSPNSVRGYIAAMHRAVDEFGDRYIRSITPTEINRFLINFIKRYHAAASTVSMQLIVISLIFKYAVIYGYIDSNPARDLSIPKGLKKERRTVPASADIQRIKDSVDKPFGMFAYMALYTGCRRGELLALTWEDIDFDQKTIVINKSLYYINNKPYLKGTKTDAGNRILPLLAKLETQLLPRKCKGLIFHDDTGKYMTEKQYRCKWDRYQKEAKIAISAHQLRHAYATMLYENDIPAKDAQILLGHAQLSTTMDIYTEIREQHAAAVRKSILNVDIV